MWSCINSMRPRPEARGAKRRASCGCGILEPTCFPRCTFKAIGKPPETDGLFYGPLAQFSNLLDLLYAPLLTPVASRNLLLYQSPLTSIPCRHAKVRRRKDDTCVGTTARSIPE